MFLDEGDVFDGLIEIPHSYLLIALGLVALADLFVLLLVDSKQRSAGPRTLDVRSARCDVKVFVHLNIIHIG